MSKLLTNTDIFPVLLRNFPALATLGHPKSIDIEIPPHGNSWWDTPVQLWVERIPDLSSQDTVREHYDIFADGKPVTQREFFDDFKANFPMLDRLHIVRLMLHISAEPLVMMTVETEVEARNNEVVLPRVYDLVKHSD